jgi:amino acid adenylation domain-containing protein
MLQPPAIAADAESPSHTDGGDATLPASFAQERLWFLHRVEPASPVYNIPLVYDVSGPLNIECLRAAVADIIRRHEALRTNFAFENGELVQVIHEETELPLDVQDLSADPAETSDERAAALTAAFSRRPFDLRCEPLLRLMILKFGAEAHRLVLNVHHTVFDGVSLGIFLQELAHCYGARLEKRSPLLPALPIQYGDFAVWQRQSLAGALLERHVGFWKERLRDQPPALELPADRQPPKQPTSAGGDVFFTIPAEVSFAMRDLCQREGMTLFMALTAAFHALLFRYTGQERMLTGAPIANRGHAETERLIGLFVNTIVLRGDLRGDPTGRELLRRTREEILSAIEHGELPFEKLVQELHVGQRDGRNPLFRTMLALQNHAALAEPPSLHLTPRSVELNAARMDLLVEMIDDGKSLRGGVSYSTDLFERSTIERFTGHFRTLLSALVESPDRRISSLPLLTTPEREQLMAWNRTDRDFPSHETLASLFDKAAARNPDGVAIVDGQQRVTYAELKRRANALAWELHGRRIGRGSLVGVPAERSARFLVAVLGIIKSGAAYVPIAADEPAERAEAMRSRCAHVIALDALPVPMPAPLPADDAVPTESAYVLFTSGSTGIPKGVVVPQIAISRLVMNNEFAPIADGDVLAFASNVCFDAATFEIWGALLNGVKLAVVPHEILLSTRELGAFLAANGVTTLFLTTALFNQIARDEPAAFRSLKHLLFGGEVCNPESVRRIFEHGAPQRLVHVYGPTEATTFASWHHIREAPGDSSTIPIGRPIANTTIHILDARLQPVPVGVTGEVFIGGPGVALGYLDDPALTAQRFIETQHGRLYRTGDLAGRRGDGSIEFRGRADSQVKLRGFRIEPGEVEAALERHPCIRDAAVVARRENGDARMLVAYLVARAAEKPGTEDLREFLSRRLPAYMMPGAFVWLEKLPLTANGKLDHRLLPAPSPEIAGAGDTHHPRNAIEHGLSEIWAEVLNRTGFTLRDDFFALGGHSLLALRLLAEIRSRFGVEVPARRLFESATIEGLARSIAQQMSPHEPAAGTFRSLFPIQRGSPKRPPLFLVPGGWGGEIEFLVYGELSRHLDPEQPIWGLKARGAGSADRPHRTVKTMAADYLKEMRAVQPHGPYLLAGECVGGICAYEMARQLELQGEKVALLMLFDTTVPTRALARQHARGETRRRAYEFWERRVTQRIRHHLQKMKGLPLREKIAYLLKRAAAHRGSAPSANTPSGQHPRGQKNYPGTLMRHKLQRYGGKVTLVLDEEFHRLYGHFGWDTAPVGALEVHVLPGDHISYIRQHAATAAAKMQELILRASADFSQ